jgi:hypothetical protein
MLALKKFIPCYAAALCIKTHSALLAAWIESNILLQLASASFDKQDETLVPEAGSCANCPKRTGFNKLLFPDVRKDSCTSPDCFQAKIDACVKKTLEAKPQLIQTSAAWNSREGGSQHCTDPQVLLAVADHFYWLNNGPAAAPLYARAEKLFSERGDARNELHAKVGRLRSEAETTGSLPVGS